MFVEIPIPFLKKPCVDNELVRRWQRWGGRKLQGTEILLFFKKRKKEKRKYPSHPKPSGYILFTAQYAHLHVLIMLTEVP